MKNSYKIIDAHCHIYPDKIASKAAASTGDFYHVTGKNDGKLSTMIAIASNAGVDHVVVQSVATHPSQVASINRYIASEVASNDMLTGLGTLHAHSEDIDGDIELIKQLGLKGVKMHADIQKIAINDRACYPIYERLEGVMPLLLHTGDSRYNYSNPENLEPVLKDFPKLTVIGAHFAGWSVWEKAVEMLSGYENLYVDTSSTIGFVGEEFAKRLIGAYSPDRILFGSDYPMWSATDEVNSLLKFGLSTEMLNKIFWQNSAKLFDIKI